MIRTLISSIAALLLVGCAFGSGVAQEPIPSPAVPVPTPSPTVQVQAAAPSPVPTAERIATVPTPSPTAQVAATAPTPLPSAPRIATVPSPLPTIEVPSTVPIPSPTAQAAATVPTPLPSAPRIATVPSPLPTVQVAATVPTPLPTAQASETEVVEEFFEGLQPPPYYGRRSIEEDIAWSSFIIRGTLDSVRAVGVRSERLPPRGYEYIGGLEYTFNVHEYLKGSGGSQLRGFAAIVWYDAFGNTAAAAADMARPHIARRDTRWDGRQAIVFMRQTEEDHIEDGYLWMGSTESIVLGGKYPVWLPDAAATSTAPGGASGTSGAAEQYFLLEDPDVVQASETGASGAAGASHSTSTISLSDLKSRVNAIEARIAAGGGSDAYRECVHMTYYFNRTGKFTTEYTRTDGAIQSGLPAGTRMVVYTDAIWINLDEHGTTTPAWVEGNAWYEGRDAALFGYEYPGYAISTRPLPMGEYRAFQMWRNRVMVPCQGDPEALRGLYENVVTVTAPAGTLHEAFFDPVLDTSTSAVGADSTNGVLKPAAFTDAGGATTTIGSLEWKSGAVKMNVSPHTALDGQALDFIELDGSVSLSLDAANATVDAANNTLSWSVASQPWEDGDTLMLRIRRGPNRPPVFDTSTYAFTVREDASAFHVIGEVSATDPDAGDSPWYYITGGNEAGRFQLGANNGELLVWVERWTMRRHRRIVGTVQIRLRLPKRA